MKEIALHPFAYLVLFIGLVLSAYLFLTFWPDRVALRILSACLGLFYIVWGVLTHIHHDKISRAVVVEYVAVGSLSSILLILLTL